jgi:hypothetical protein
MFFRQIVILIHIPLLVYLFCEIWQIPIFLFLLFSCLPIFVCVMYNTFGDLISDLVEVYIDDIIVKVKSSASLLNNFALVFDRLWLIRTKLNLNKCVFRVTAGKLLGFLISCRGLRLNSKRSG